MRRPARRLVPRPHVLHVTMPTSGTTARTVLSYVREQTGRGWGVTVVCPSEGWLAYSAREAGADVAWFPVGRRPGLSMPDEVTRLAAVLRSQDPVDLVHLHGGRAGLSGRLAARGRMATVFSPHGWTFDDADSSVPAPLARGWERLATRWTDQVICATDREAGLAAQRGIRAPVCVVSPGVDLTEFVAADVEDRRQARGRLGLRDVATVVCVGPLRAEQGQSVLLEGWAGIERAFPDAQLILVGDGPDRDPLLDAAARLRNVSFAGHRADVSDWLAAADLVVAPAAEDRGAAAALEAMAVGRSVVAFATAGVEESVPHDCGALVPPGDVEKLTAAISIRLADPFIAADEGERGWHHATAHRDAAGSARQVTQVALGLMASRTHR